MAFSLVDDDAISQTLLEENSPQRRKFTSAERQMTEDDHENSAYMSDDSTEMEPFLSSSCPNLTMKVQSPSTMSEDMDPLNCILGSSSSVQNAMSYVDSSMQTAKEISIHAKEKVHQALESVDRFAHKVWDGRQKIAANNESGVRVTVLAKQYGLAKYKISMIKNKEAIMAADVAKGVTVIAKQRSEVLEEVEKFVLVD